MTNLRGANLSDPYRRWIIHGHAAAYATCPILHQ